MQRRGRGKADELSSYDKAAASKTEAIDRKKYKADSLILTRGE
ncbi:hypothetical protein RINTU1_16340 [Candidatus Regiella insecticola]|uniref:Uncharacterized protein n=1 Tax=Candidatus Regiella insecticola TaxID=138073 RepID=A0A6L2ZMY2_9ENTR|nr:hypothetical protein RINTU1_16340 [Candidatus Regiella insecticola]